MRMTMLVGALMAAALVAFPGALSGQIQIGAEAGLNFSTLAGDDVNEDAVETKTGFYLGGSVGIPLEGIFSVGTGLYYVQKGADGTDGASSIDLDYLQVPVMVTVEVTGPDRPVVIGLSAGPALNLNLSCDSSDEGVSFDCGDEVTSTTLGALFGANASFPAGERATVTVQGGLDMDLTSFDDTPEDNDYKTRSYYLGVGVSIPMGG